MKCRYVKRKTVLWNQSFKIVSFLTAKAALWGAQTIYVAAQLMLYRETKPADLETLLPSFTGEVLASADLTLRFLPDIITHLTLIDPEDTLIELLEKHLYVWHFSGIWYPLETENLNFKAVSANPCLHQMYSNRVIAAKKAQLANHPALKERVNAAMGIFAADFWRDLS